MANLSTLRTLLKIEESQTRLFSKIAEKAQDPEVRAVFQIMADNEATHAKWVRELIFRREENGQRKRVGRKKKADPALVDIRAVLSDENSEAEWYGEIAEKATDPEVKITLKTIAGDERRNAELVKGLLARFHLDKK